MNSNFLTGLSNVAGAAADIGSIASGFGAVTGVAKGVGNLLGLGGNQQKQQYKYQKKLMEYQNQLNQQNSLLDYQRQRELTADNPMLQKIGLRNAGMNTAMGDGSTASAASVGSTSPSSTPSPLPTDAQIDSQYSGMMNQSLQSLMAYSQSRAQTALLNEQAENMRTRNLTQLQSDLMDIAQKRANTTNINLRNQYDRMYYEAESKYYEMNAKNKAYSLDNDTFMKDMDSFYYGQEKENSLQLQRENILKIIEERKLVKKDNDFYYKKLALIDSQIEANNASAADSRSHVGVNETQTELNSANTEKSNSETEYQYIQNNIAKATKESVIKAAKLAVQEHGPQSINEWSWSVFNNWDDASTSEKIGACIGLPFGFVERALGGAATGAGFSLGNNATTKAIQKKPRPIGFRVH